jgi:hypothetical protein
MTAPVAGFTHSSKLGELLRRQPVCTTNSTLLPPRDFHVMCP